MQFASNVGMSNDAPIHECESEIDHYTAHLVEVVHLKLHLLNRFDRFNNFLL